MSERIRARQVNGGNATALVPLNEGGKRYWIEKVGLVLNGEVGLGLAKAWSMEWTMSAIRIQEETVKMGRIFAIGASNAGR